MGRIAAIVQARTGSTRLPGKALVEVASRPLLAWVLERAQAIAGLDIVALATTTAPQDRELLPLAAEMHIPAFTGSVDDVLDRYYQVGCQLDCSTVMRLTGDCPLLDPGVSAQVLQRYLRGGVDYVSNSNPPTFPHGLDTEVFSFEALAIAHREAELKTEREHVTQFIRRRPDRFRIANVSAPADLSQHRWAVDHPEDLDFVRSVYEGLVRRGWQGHRYHEVLRVIEEDGLQDASSLFERDEGLKKTMKQDGLLA